MTMVFTCQHDTRGVKTCLGTSEINTLSNNKKLKVKAFSTVADT